jgi:sortase A
MSDDLTMTMRSQAADAPSRGAGARLVRMLAYALIAIGALALVDAGVTLLWQEPITALYAKFEQDDLHSALAKIEARAAPSAAERHALAQLPTEAQRIELLAREFERHAKDGSPVGMIHIPKIEVNYVFVKGTGTSELEKGPGTYAGTSFPGIPGTTSIAGHRTTYLAPFHNINALHKGDVIYLDMPYAHFAYTVTGQRTVYPNDVRAATAEVGYSRLVLSACTPLFSAEKRLLVYARLNGIVTASQPGGAMHLSTATNTVARGA